MTKKNYITWDHPMLIRFKARFEQAKTANESQFSFEGNEFVTDYAKYLIEYLETRLVPNGLPHTTGGTK